MYWGYYGRPRHPPMRHGVSDPFLFGTADLDDIPNYTSDPSNDHSKNKLPPITWNPDFKHPHPHSINPQAGFFSDL